MVNNPVTAFATIINNGTTPALQCMILPISGLPFQFLYQVTDHANALIGAPNTPVDIDAGVSQSFLIAPTPTGQISPSQAFFSFSCSNATAASIVTGLNTLLVSASTSPVPDIVAIAAADVGIVNIAGANGAGAFAVATVNVGVAATITATANTGAASLPIAIGICQTDPPTGVCTSPVGASVTTTIAARATPTFAVFVGGNGVVPFDPANNRIFVQFADPGGVVRGATSVAVRTQ